MATLVILGSATPLSAPLNVRTLPPNGMCSGVCREDAQVCYYGDGSYPCENKLECIESYTLVVRPQYQNGPNIVPVNIFGDAFALG
ncbi:hypothetical protein VTL71DRAFT_10372 [Oculimacula yallundae]|uniref:Uncharacterized protein n=1 Tax=Oculimacula yallundae TaxID=86028 RepID=A0ABR4CTE5_9HELO